MTISFNGIPNNLRVPFLYAEFDASNAQQGLDVIPYKVLLIGQRRSGGSVDALTPSRITSATQASQYFGAGSVLHSMAEAFFPNNPLTEVWAVALDDGGAHVAATGTIALSGTPTAAGTLAVYIAGRKVEIGITTASTATTAGAALAAAINANTSLPVTAAADTGTVTLTAKHKGLFSNGIDVRLNFASEDVTPAGLSAVITAMASGTGTPDLATIWSVIEDDQYQIIAMPYTDSTSLAALETELADRWGPLRQQEGNAFVASAGDLSALGTLGDSQNSPHLSIITSYGSPSPVWEWAAALAGVVAQYGNTDPARPFQTLPLAFVKTPPKDTRFTLAERNLLLFDGISTFNVDSSGQVRVERVITTYKTNEVGASDTAYLDVTTPLTLGYLRATLRNRFLRKFPRHKLADDGVRYGNGQAIVTPKVAKAEVVAWFAELADAGLVENIDQFKRDLVVERNATDRNRLDMIVPPDLINQLMVTGVKIGFLL